MKKKMPNPYKENCAIIAGFVTEGLCLVMGRTVPLGELVRNVFSYISIGRIIFFEIVYLGALLTIYICNRKGINWLDKIYKFRYVIAAVILLVCMIFQINGSSIGCWDGVTGYNIDTGILAGTSRAIRSDEWAVSTPMALSQKANNYEYFNSNIRGGYASDMFIVYGQPVKDVSIIFRVFHIGYLLFGSGIGLSFYWCARFLALFLASFEFLMLITNKKKMLSCLGAIIIVFSPTIQWWYATNSLMEMIISAEVGLILFDKYLKTDNFKLKTLYMAIMAICVGTFILTFYPAWMVPIAYIFVPFLIWIIIENRATLNTVYPGKRIVLEKGNLNIYVGFMVNSLLTILTSIDNPCDMAVMMDFWPIALILISIYVLKEKKKDILITMCLYILIKIYLIIIKVITIIMCFGLHI